MIKRNNLSTVILSIFLAIALSMCVYGCDPELEPETPEPTFLDEPGEFTVATLDTEFENDNGTYPVTIYYPVDESCQSPGIVFSPGLGATKDMYEWVGNHLASHGYTLLMFTVPKRFTIKTAQHEAGFVSGFEMLEAEKNNPDSPLYGHVDLNKPAIMGHSLGGLASLRAAETMHVDAVVALAPAPGLEEESLIDATEPTQIQTATQDCITGDELASTYYGLLTADTKQIIDIYGGNHIQFNDDDLIGGQLFDCQPEIEIEQHQRLSRRYFTAWLDYFIKDDRSVEPYLFGEYAEQDLLSGYLSMWEFVKD